MIFNCFGLVIHGYNMRRITDEVLTRAATGHSTWIVTANPEILLHAKDHPDYWEILRQADIRSVDGFGLQILGCLRGKRPARISGVELSLHIVRLCEQMEWRLALLGGQNGVADRAAWTLRKQYPTLQVLAFQGGSVTSDGLLDERAGQDLHHLIDYQPDVILVAYGHPKQETWIYKHRLSLPTVKLFMGVGGTFDYWAGTVKRAPVWMQKIGLEWLFRLIAEPKRWKRIWNAVAVFPIKVIISK